MNYNIIYGMGVAVMGVSHLLHGIAKGNHVKKNTYYTRKPFFQKKKKLQLMSLRLLRKLCTTSSFILLILLYNMCLEVIFSLFKSTDY